MDTIATGTPAEVPVCAVKSTNWNHWSCNGLILEKKGGEMWINNRRKPEVLHRRCPTEGNTLGSSSIQINYIFFFLLLRGMRGLAPISVHGALKRM